MRPLIGITCGHQWEEPERFYVNAAYVHCITDAGGTPILIPYMAAHKLRSLLISLDGLLVPGGIDVDARLFNQEIHPKSGIIDPWWDELDITMIQGALELDLPVLAICRGCQVLNVACGGTLIQDIESFVTQPIKHQQQAPKWYATHSISLADNSLLAAIFDASQIQVNSFHHQAVAQVAPGFQISATASDGVIEAIESTMHRFVVGVQWHPELMASRDPIARRLFTQFIAAAEQSR